MLVAGDPQSFIRENLPLTPVPAIPEIRLHTAHPGSRLGRLLDRDDDPAPPYWAYPWSGGAVLARYVLDHPATVRGRRILDLGAGGGIVAIAAALAGAAVVTAAEVDGYGIAALERNAAANGVTVTALHADLLKGPVPDVDLVLAGDLFYERELAERAAAFFERCVAEEVEVLVGDPGRADLPRERLIEIAAYRVPEVGATRGAATTPAAVYRFRGSRR